MSINHKNIITFRTVISFLAVYVILSYSQVTWDLHTVHDDTHGTSSLHACDLDNDSDLDVLGAVLEDNQMVWWRNDGGSPIGWTKCIIDNSIYSPYSIYAADIDGDNDQDVLGAGNSQIIWWRNEGGNPVTWTEFPIRSYYNFAHEVYAYDLDDDGDTDVLGASTNLDQISWWRNDGGDTIQWTEQTIGSNFDGAKSVRVGDLDDDGDNDIVGACLYGDRITWWRNDGGDTIQWTEFDIDIYFTGAHRVQIIDLDADQDLDILAVAYLQAEIAWYRNDGGDPVQWTKQTIGTGFGGACIAQAADLDGDGDLDVAGTAQTSHQVAWWRNDGGSPIVWTKLFIDDYFYRPWPLYVCDIDEDNDQDAISASSWNGTNNVNWYENTPTGIAEDNNPFKSVDTRYVTATIVSGPLPLPKNHAYTIYNISGQQINSSNPPPGIYFIRQSKKTIGKLVKIK